MMDEIIIAWCSGTFAERDWGEHFVCPQVKQRQEEEKRQLVALRDQLRPVVHTEQVSDTIKKNISAIHSTSSEWMWCLSVGHFTQAGVLYASADGRQTVRDRESRIPLQEEWRVKKTKYTLTTTCDTDPGRDLNLYVCVLGWGKCGRRGNVQFTTVTWPSHMPPWVYLCVCVWFRLGEEGAEHSMCSCSMWSMRDGDFWSVFNMTSLAVSQQPPTLNDFQGLWGLRSDTRR